ncbi:MAG: DUF4169 family protein [Magnetovibrio sp.]|nr:DUF4169 family protein [Magnetovibrio sp.]
MADIVNLNRFRKAKARSDKEKRAEEKRVKFGRTKAEKQENNANRALVEKKHAGKKLGENKKDSAEDDS